MQSLRRILTVNSLLLPIITILIISCSTYNQPKKDNNAQLPKQRILLLNSYNHGYRWSDHIVRAIRDKFKDNPDIVIHIEYMDTKMVSNRTHFELLKQLEHTRTN